MPAVRLLVATGLLLVSMRQEDHSLSWAPDGKRPVFVRGSVGVKTSKIVVIDRDGTNERVLVAGRADNYRPSWSPDGKRIAFQSCRGGPSQIHVIDVDGTNLRQITQFEGGADEPAWAPLR